MSGCCGRARGWVGLAFRWRRARRKLENSIKREERPKGEGVRTSQRGEAPAGGGTMRCMGQEGGGIGYFGDLAEEGGGGVFVRVRGQQGDGGGGGYVRQQWRYY